MRYSLDGITMDIIDGWVDITDETDGYQPITLAREDGVGALQFSVATYVSGKPPSIDAKALRAMLLRFVSSEGFRSPLGLTSFERTGTSFAVAEFRKGDVYLKTWFVSDGMSACHVTYNCLLHHKGQEVDECDGMVATIRFKRQLNEPACAGKGGDLQ